MPDETARFWSEGHQAAEREADADLAAGRYTEFMDAAQFLEHLARLDNSVVGGVTDKGPEYEPPG